MRIIAVILFSLLLACQPNGKNATLSPDRYLIAYNVLVYEKSEDYEVVTMEWDGTQKRNITDYPSVEWTYGAFEDKLFFLSDRLTCDGCNYLYVTDHLGRKPRKVYDTRLADSWMSFRNNGTEIIVRPYRGLDSAFHIINLRGELLQRLETGLPTAADPLFVNGGEQVVFRGGTKKYKREAGYEEELYRINLDGTGLTQLTDYPQSDTTAPWYAYKAGPPRLHPTEQFISYGSFQNGKYRLFGVTLDGKKQWPLLDLDDWIVYHDWSPDGKWLVADVSRDRQDQFDIALINWETKALTVLTDSSFRYEQAPVFVAKSIE